MKTPTACEIGDAHEGDAVGLVHRRLVLDPIHGIYSSGWYAACQPHFDEAPAEDRMTNAELERRVFQAPRHRR